MVNMQGTAIIRDRGQLTIPDSIRKSVNWVAPLSAVTISMVNPDEIIIRPHKQQVNWDQLWKDIKKSRSAVGKGKVSASEFIQTDRESH